MKDSILKEKVFTQPIDKVWRAITVAEEISEWFIKADFKAEVGYNYTFTASEEHGCTVVKGEVLEATPYTLKYTWTVADSDIKTVVEWTLNEEQGATKLTLVHSEISNYDGETALEMIGHFSKGWDACILGLDQFVKNEIEEPAH